MGNWLRRLLMSGALLASSTTMAFDHSYADYSALLVRHVQWTAQGHASAVDYAGLKREHRQLASVQGELSSISQREFDRWSREQQMAFLINAYNFFTQQLVLTKHPDLASIKDLGNLFRSSWKIDFFELLGGRRYLDWIEHEQLRPRYRDPRVHFAVNCASIGCPALRPEAYVAERLEAQLEDQQRRFLGDRIRNRYNAADGSLSVSPIFKWFAADFEDAAGGVTQWLATRAVVLADSERDRARIHHGDL
jgi:hypothetical protein